MRLITSLLCHFHPVPVIVIALTHLPGQSTSNTVAKWSPGPSPEASDWVRLQGEVEHQQRTQATPQHLQVHLWCLRCCLQLHKVFSETWRFGYCCLPLLPLFRFNEQLELSDTYFKCFQQCSGSQAWAYIRVSWKAFWYQLPGPTPALLIQ